MPTTFGTATALFVFSWSWIFPHASQTAPPAASTSRPTMIHGHHERRGGSS